MKDNVKNLIYDYINASIEEINMARELDSLEAKYQKGKDKVNALKNKLSKLLTQYEYISVRIVDRYYVIAKNSDSIIIEQCQHIETDDDERGNYIQSDERI